MSYSGEVNMGMLEVVKNYGENAVRQCLKTTELWVGDNERE
jgi:hypothetical protein